jgi:phage tail-like protein
MARLTPDLYKPQLSFRFRITFSQLPDVQFYGKAVNLPTVDNSPITLEYGNTQMKLKGKTKWNDVTITCYAYEKMTIDQLWQYLTDLHQDIIQGWDEYGETYKKDVQIQLLAPSTETVVGTWKLIGAFMSNVNFGELDWSAEEIVQPTLTLSYDYAVFERVV